MNNNEIEKFLNLSKRNLKEKSLIYLIDNFSRLSKKSVRESENLLEDYLFNKFINSKFKDFDMFIESVLDEEGVQISANIPQSVRPERPVDEELTEEGEEEKNSNSQEDKLETIEDFLENIGLLNLNKEDSEKFVYRFKYTLEGIIEDEDVLNLLSSLLLKAKENPEELTSAEVDELSDVVFSFNNSPQQDSLDESAFLFEADKEESSSKTIGVIATVIGGGLLFGVGGLLMAGLFFALSGSSDEDVEKTKAELEKNKAELEKIKAEAQAERDKELAELKKEKEEAKKKGEPWGPKPPEKVAGVKTPPKAKPEDKNSPAPENFAKDLEEKGNKAKSELVSKAKKKAKEGGEKFQKSIETRNAKKDKVAKIDKKKKQTTNVDKSDKKQSKGKAPKEKNKLPTEAPETAKEPEETSEPISSASQAKKYASKHGKAPKGWRKDAKGKYIKSESIEISDLYSLVF